MPTLEDVLANVRERVTPSEVERARLESALEETIARTQAAIEDLPIEAEAIQVGSTARDTWLASDRDIDVFVRFPSDRSRDELEEYGLEVGYAVLPEGREEYAEHPYVTGSIDGFDVDLVPCYDVDDASDIESAVDRTPFHARYVAGRLTPDLASEVRVCKQFTRAIGVYGSNLETRGFSGYLVELLVLEFGSARAVLEAAADWQPPVCVDPEGHGAATFDDALVVIDPTDPTRNVAAVLSRENLARVQHYAREVLDSPRLEAFEVGTRSPIDADAVAAELSARETTPVALVFETPDLVADDLHPQIRKTLSGIRAALDRNGFEPIRTDYFTRDRTVLFFELEVATRPAIERHRGPPVHVRPHADDFYEQYEADDDVYGPFVEGDRYVLERRRRFTSAVDLLESESLFDARIAPAIDRALESERVVLEGPDIATLAEEFGTELASYFDPEP